MLSRTSTTMTADRETLLRRHVPLVRGVARRMLANAAVPADLDDLVSWGMLGLLDAFRRYDPARATLFSTFARFRIRGAILDQLRALDWVPRSVRQRGLAVERATRALETRLGRPPNEEELAAALTLSVEAFRTLRRDVALTPVQSLECSTVGGEEGRLPFDGTEPGPLAILLQRERLRHVTAAIRLLPDRDQLLLSLYYRDELSMKEVGAVLGLTESRVSQLHTRVLRRLRTELREPELQVA